MNVVNLNKARKTKARIAGKARAAENRVKFGRTKAETAKAAAEAAKLAGHVDGAKRER